MGRPKGSKNKVKAKMKSKSATVKSPTKHTIAFRRKVLETLANTGNIAEVVRTMGVSRHLIRSWMRSQLAASITTATPTAPIETQHSITPITRVDVLDLVFKSPRFNDAQKLMFATTVVSGG